MPALPFTLSIEKSIPVSDIKLLASDLLSLVVCISNPPNVIGPKGVYYSNMK